MGKRTTGAEAPKDKTGERRRPGTKPGSKLPVSKPAPRTVRARRKKAGITSAFGSAEDYQVKPGGPFKPGNPGGPGNPLAHRVHLHRQAVNQAADPDDTVQIWKALAKLALSGDVAAIKLYLERLEGRMPQEVKISELDGKTDPDTAYL